MTDSWYSLHTYIYTTVKNCNSYNRGRNRGHHFKRMFLFFADNLAVGLDFLIIQDKNNISTLSVNINSVARGFSFCS